MAEPVFTVGSSSYYLQFDGLDDLPIKSIAQVSYEGKGTGAQKPIACGRGGITFRQTTIGGYETHPTMTIEVYLCGDANSASFRLYEWFQACLPASDGGQSDWENNRKTGSIVVYDPSGNERLRWNLFRAWPVKYSIADADVTGDALAVETFEITAEKIVKELSMTDTGGAASSMPAPTAVPV